MLKVDDLVNISCSKLSSFPLPETEAGDRSYNRTLNMVWLTFSGTSCNLVLVLVHFLMQFYARLHVICYVIVLFIFIPHSPLTPSLRLRRNRRHVADDIFKYIFLNENVWISIKVPLKFDPKGPNNNIPALVQIMDWRRPGDKPLSEPIMILLLTHICVTRPQWVNYDQPYVRCHLTSESAGLLCVLHIQQPHL